MNFIKPIPDCEYKLTSPEMLQKLQEICWEKNPEVIIEVGTFLGCGSTKVFHDAIVEKDGELICVDNCVVNFNNTRFGLARTESHYHLLLNNLKRLSNARLFRASSEEASKIIEHGIADIVYIDAGHSFKDVCLDIANWYPKLKKNGVFCGDDYNIPDVKRAVDELLPQAKNNGRVWWIKL